jgi:ABC-2 type transport system ATP-binding protein
MPNNLLAAAAGGAGKPPAGLLLALVPLVVLILGLDVYCLIDLARAKSVRNVPKWVWALVILFVSAPLGPLVYLFAGRDRGQDGPVAEAPQAPVEPRPPVAGRPQVEPASPVERRPPVAEGPPVTKGPPVAEGPPVEGRSSVAGRPPVELGAPGEGLPAGCQPIVTTSGLTRDYGGAGLFDVDLVVPRGSVYGLVGPNGAGKTTLLSLLCAIRRPDRGTISLRIARNKVAVCPDVPEFDGWLTAAEVTDLARSLVAPAAGSAAVATALAAAGLADVAGRRVGGFSRGMVQRLGLACALVGEPELLILDEPTSALDPAGRAEMLSLVAAMRGHRTVIFSSHILSDVQRIADQVGILRGGRLLYQGATKDLIDTYLEPSWLVRIAGDLRPVAAALAGEPWATRAEPVGAGTLRVDATSIEAGERGIPAVIAGCGARQVSCEPVAADLESAFLALTGASQGE